MRILFASRRLAEEASGAGQYAARHGRLKNSLGTTPTKVALPALDIYEFDRAAVGQHWGRQPRAYTDGRFAAGPRGL